MAITFIEKRKRKTQYLVVVLIIVILITGVVLWRGFFARERSVLPPVEIETPTQKVEINFEALKNPILDELQPFEVIPPFEGEVGRENPFRPY